MDEWMNGCMDGWLNYWLWLWLLQWLCVSIGAIISSSETINYKATTASTLAGTAVTAAYATAALNPLLGK